MLNRLREWAATNAIERPPGKLLDVIDAIVRDMRDVEDSLRFLRKRLEDEVRNVREKADTEQELSAAANYIYWMLPEVTSSSLIDGLEDRIGANASLLRKWNKPIPTVCEQCGVMGKVHCHTREELHKLLGGKERWHFVCADCRAKEAEEAVASRNRFYARLSAEGQVKRDAQAAAEQAKLEAQEKRLWELRRMPYADYLQTPEWQERRTRHLDSVGHRCQLCNASGPRLQLHHRNYERRGQEQFYDLLVLCRNCHDLFHKGAV